MKERWYPRTATDADMGRTRRRGWVPTTLDLRYLASLEDAHADETAVREWCEVCGKSAGFDAQDGDENVRTCLACGAEAPRVERGGADV